MAKKNTLPLNDYLRERIQVNENGCWIWQCAKSPAGYGYTGVTTQFKTNKAHRLSYSVFKGPIPKGKLIRHTCDVPSCINPDHLLVGTDADNSKDKWSRGRGAIGSMIGASKLTDSDVIEIRSKSSNGVLGKDLAIAYAVSTCCISDIINRKSWRHI